MSRLALPVLLLLATPALAQRPGCGFGLGLAALRQAGSGLEAAARAASLLTGLDTAAAVAPVLADATSRLAGCGCARAAAEAGDAAGLAEQARSEATLDRLRATLDRARFFVSRARHRLDTRGCD